jgi:group I intron endonuclease
MTLKKTGIYKITSPKNKVYIGQSIDIQKRFRAYKSLGCKLQTKLYNSLKKYGVDYHTFDVLIECNKEDLNELEKYFIAVYNSSLNGLNIRSGGLSESPSVETRLKMSLAHKGDKAFWFGKKMPLESRIKMSKNRIGKYCNGNHPMARVVLNLETGIYYDTVTEAAESISLKRTTLIMKLRGNNYNNTNLIYA